MSGLSSASGLEPIGWVASSAQAAARRSPTVNRSGQAPPPAHEARQRARTGTRVARRTPWILPEAAVRREGAVRLTLPRALATVRAVSGLVRGPDGGPIYTETDLDRFIAEPFNAGSNLLFLVIVVYWALRIRREPSRFVAGALPVLFVGFVGGTVYHATRSHPVWLAMDWLPIFALCVAASVRYVRRLGASRRSLLLVYGAPFAVIGLLGAVLPDELRPLVLPAVGYTTLASWVAGPLFLYVRAHPTLDRGPLVAAVAAFLVAISLRSLDRVAPWPLEATGTHFLWHAFGALSAHFVIGFVHADDQTSRANGQ